MKHCWHTEGSYLFITNYGSYNPGGDCTEHDAVCCFCSASRATEKKAIKLPLAGHGKFYTEFNHYEVVGTNADEECPERKGEVANA